MLTAQLIKKVLTKHNSSVTGDKSETSWVRKESFTGRQEKSGRGVFYTVSFGTSCFLVHQNNLTFYNKSIYFLYFCLKISLCLAEKMFERGRNRGIILSETDRGRLQAQVREYCTS